MQYILCFIVQQNPITTAIKLVTLQQNGRYHVHDACQSPYICKQSGFSLLKKCHFISEM